MRRALLGKNIEEGGEEVGRGRGDENVEEKVEQGFGRKGGGLMDIQSYDNRKVSVWLYFSAKWKLANSKKVRGLRAGVDTRSTMVEEGG